MKSSKALAASLLTNLVLLLLLGSFARRSARNADVQFASPPPDPAPAAAPASAPIDASPVPAPSFQWSEIESTNYPTFVANLRAIGCPEKTIRDIVSADVEALYAPRRRELQLREDALNADPSKAVPWAKEAIGEEARKLALEESTLIAQLLGAPAPGDDAANDSATGSRRSRETGVTMPLVFQPVNTNLLDFNDSQWAVINELRQKFIDQVGGGNPDPSDPEYRQRWKEAQPAIDYQLRAELGDWSFLELQGATIGPVAAPQ